VLLRGVHLWELSRSRRAWLVWVWKPVALLGRSNDGRHLRLLRGDNMALPKSVSDIKERVQEARNIYRDRDQLVLLTREMYRMVKDRKSTFLGTSEWRSSVHEDYWQSSSRPHNAVDVATAVLAGHPPQYKVTEPGAVGTSVCSRAEKFLHGVWRANSRMQHYDLYRRLIHRTVLDGAAGIRVTWNVMAPDPMIIEDEEGYPVAYYPRNKVPIDIRIVKWDQLYPMGHPTHDTPFSELLQVSARTLESVKEEWEEIEGAKIPKVKLDRNQTGEYIEWWGYEDGEVHYMVTFENEVVIPNKPVPYRRIPYIISTFKEEDEDDKVFGRVPFLYPVIPATEKEEYLRSRMFRQLDMILNMLPYHTGGTPTGISGQWGEVLEFPDDKEKIAYPMPPPSTPDAWKVLEDTIRQQSQGTFSETMFGEVSTRMSGYGLSQLIGADTLRTDTPRANLELTFSAVGDLIFDMLRWFSPGHRIAVTIRSKQGEIAAKLAGFETETLVLETFLKPKQSSDEVRLATVGAQLSALPQRPVSMAYILENYFGIAQPEDEIHAVLQDEALRDPLVRLIAMAETLKDADSPYMPLIAMQVMMALQKVTASGAPGTIPGMGMGMPQAALGNPTQGPEPGEVGMTPEAAMYGGPRGE